MRLKSKYLGRQNIFGEARRSRCAHNHPGTGHAARYGKDADLSLLTELPDYKAELAAVNHSPYEVAGGIDGREPRIGAKNNGCLASLGLIPNPAVPKAP